MFAVPTESTSRTLVPPRLVQGEGVEGVEGFASPYIPKNPAIEQYTNWDRHGGKLYKVLKGEISLAGKSLGKTKASIGTAKGFVETAKHVAIFAVKFLATVVLVPLALSVAAGLTILGTAVTLVNYGKFYNFFGDSDNTKMNRVVELQKENNNLTQQNFYLLGLICNNSDSLSLQLRLDQGQRLTMSDGTVGSVFGENLGELIEEDSENQVHLSGGEGPSEPDLLDVFDAQTTNNIRRTPKQSADDLRIENQRKAQEEIQLANQKGKEIREELKAVLDYQEGIIEELQNTDKKLKKEAEAIRNKLKDSRKLQQTSFLKSVVEQGREADKVLDHKKAALEVIVEFRKWYETRNLTEEPPLLCESSLLSEVGLLRFQINQNNQTIKDWEGKSRPESQPVVQGYTIRSVRDFMDYMETFPQSVSSKTPSVPGWDASTSQEPLDFVPQASAPDQPPLDFEGGSSS